MKNIEGLSASQTALLRKAAKKDVKIAGAGPNKTARSLDAAGLGKLLEPVAGKRVFQATAAGKAKAGK